MIYVLVIIFGFISIIALLLPRSYQMVEDISEQLQQMGGDIKSVIDRVNQANVNQDENSPVSICVCDCVYVCVWVCVCVRTCVCVHVCYLYNYYVYECVKCILDA